MTANILSFVPSCAIKLIGNNNDSNLYEIWIQLSPKGGVINFKTDTPEHTTFHGISGTPPLTGNPYMTVTPYFIYHQRYQQPAPYIGRNVLDHQIGGPNRSWYRICNLNLGTNLDNGKHISMELVGSNGYDVVSNLNRNWRLFMHFMSSDSLSFKNATETDYEVHGLMFADLTVYQLSNNGIGPDRIALVQNGKSN
jgi:hypothetical protein